jgi:hypothetical protein
VKAGLAQGDAAGFCLAAVAAGGLEVDDVVHSKLFRAWPLRIRTLKGSR